MQAASFFHSPASISRFFNYLGIIVIVAFAGPVLFNWNELTSCFQRQAVVVSISLLYWRFQKFVDPTYFIENLQFFVVFLFAEKLNSLEQENDSTCLQVATFTTKMIFAVYYLMFSYYIGALLALMALVLAVVGYQIYYMRYVLPRRRLEMSLIGEEFEQLETVKLDAQQPDQEPITCSICLMDFEEEVVIKLPICNHLYHKECLKIWLQNSKECPNCRADIKVNVKLAKEKKVQESQQEKQVEIAKENNNKEKELSLEKIEKETGGEVHRRNSASINVNVNVPVREEIRIELGSRLLDRN